MHKRIKHLIKNMKDVFNIDEINEIAKDTRLKDKLITKKILKRNVEH